MKKKEPYKPIIHFFLISRRKKKPLLKEIKTIHPQKLLIFNRIGKRERGRQMDREKEREREKEERTVIRG